MSSASLTSIGVTPKMIINALLRLDYLGYKTRIEDIVKIVSRNFPTTSNLNRLRREISTKVRCCIAAGLLTRDGLSLKPTPRGRRPRLYKQDVATFWNVYRSLTNSGKKSRRKMGRRQAFDRLHLRDTSSEFTGMSSEFTTTDSDYAAKDDINYPVTDDTEMSEESSMSTIGTASNYKIKSPTKRKTRPKRTRCIKTSYPTYKTSQIDRRYRRIYHPARFVSLLPLSSRGYNNAPRKWQRRPRPRYSSDDDDRHQDSSTDSAETIQYWMQEPRAKL